MWRRFFDVALLHPGSKAPGFSYSDNGINNQAIYSEQQRGFIQLFVQARLAIKIDAASN
jgi:hypothetical protein